MSGINHEIKKCSICSPTMEKTKVVADVSETSGRNGFIRREMRRDAVCGRRDAVCSQRTQQGQCINTRENLTSPEKCPSTMAEVITENGIGPHTKNRGEFKRNSENGLETKESFSSLPTTTPDATLENALTVVVTESTKEYSIEANNITHDISDPTEKSIQNGVEKPPETSEGGWGWLVVLGAAIINMMFGINYRMFGLVYLEVRERFQAGATESAWVGGFNLLLGGFCGPIGAWMLARYSHRTITALGTTLAAIGMIGTGYVPNLPLVYVTYGLLTGVGIALAHLSAVAMVGEYFDKRKALALALQSVTSGLSAVIFSPLMALLFTEFHYSGTFLIFGGIFLHMFVASALFRPIKDKATEKSMDNEKLLTEKTAAAKQPPLRQKFAMYNITISQTQIVKKSRNDSENTDYLVRANYTNGPSTPSAAEKSNTPSNITKSVNSDKNISEHKATQLSCFPCCRSMCIALRNPVFLVFFLLMLSVTAGRAVTSSFLPALAMEFGTSLTEASMLPAISGVAAATGSLLVGAAFDTKPVRKYRIYLYAVNTFVTGATMLWMPFTSSFKSLAIPTALHGVSSTVIFAQQMTVLTDLLGKKHAVAGLGVVRIALALGSILGRTVSAVFVDILNSNKFGFYITSCMPMVASVLFVTVAWVHSRRNKKDSNIVPEPTPL